MFPILTFLFPKQGHTIFTYRIEYLLFPMDCIDINFSVIISSDIYDWVNTSAGGVLVPESIIRPVVNASALTWFIRCIFYRNLQFLIIIKTYGFPSSCIGDLSRFLAIMFNFFQFNSILDSFKICFLAPN